MFTLRILVDGVLLTRFPTTVEALEQGRHIMRAEVAELVRLGHRVCVLADLGVVQKIIWSA